jgi:putative SbcD/Mre11-related phosphoesterase
LNLNKNRIAKNIEIVDLGLKIQDYLVISDLHLGYEQSLNTEGLMIPKFQFEKIISRLEEINSVSATKSIVINGDLKHEFGKITRQEWKEVNSFLSYLQDNFQEIVLIKGNHDNFIPYITKKLGIEVKETFSIENVLLLHGHQIPDNMGDIKEDTLIIGHEHPCIGLRSGERVEKIKCFLKGEFKGKNLIVMPSFNFVSEGSDILHEKLLSPFLKNYPLDNFEAYGIENFEVFPFGKIKDIIKVSQQFI